LYNKLSLSPQFEHECYLLVLQELQLRIDSSG